MRIDLHIAGGALHVHDNHRAAGGTDHIDHFRIMAQGRDIVDHGGPGGQSLRATRALVVSMEMGMALRSANFPDSRKNPRQFLLNASPVRQRAGLIRRRHR